MTTIKTHIEFKSNFGFVPAQTVNAAIREIKKNDATSHEHLQRGWDGQKTHVYLKTDLTSVEVRSILTKFIQKYDYLYFYLTVKA